MKPMDANMADRVLAWASTMVGTYEIVSGAQRPDGRSSISRLRTSSGFCYLKVHEQRDTWAQELHGYERWADAFEGFAPSLLGVHEEAPLALIIGELPGAVLKDVDLPVEQERAVWRSAGQMLAQLHGYAEGHFFGPCRRDGSPAGEVFGDAVEYVSSSLEREIEKANQFDYLRENELAVLRSAQGKSAAFADEPPIPCHRDYCPYNWLVDERGEWCGVIDFEFAHWDIRVADFSRYPDWEWIDRPDLLDAFFEGYGRALTPAEAEQRLVAYAQYALSAITWGMEASYFGFVEEGRQALKELAGLLDT